MSPRQSKKTRAACFEAHKRADETGRIYLLCHICDSRIDPAKEKWDADHVVRRILGGSDLPSNVFPAHERCHETIKTPKDITENEKGKRVRDRHFGIKQSSGSFRNSRFRRKVSGETVER